MDNFVVVIRKLYFVDNTDINTSWILSSSWKLTEVKGDVTMTSTDYSFRWPRISPTSECITFSLLLLLCATSSFAATDLLATGSNSNTPCPTWYVPTPSTNGSMVCECGSDLGTIVWCHKETQEVSIRNNYCMTYSITLNDTVVGYCPYTYNYTNTWYSAALPQNVSELNNYVCAPFHREGQACGQCVSGYSPGWSPYSSACVKCTSNQQALVFLATQIVLATVFFVFIITFHIDISSGTLCAWLCIL